MKKIISSLLSLIIVMLACTQAFASSNTVIHSFNSRVNSKILLLENAYLEGYDVGTEIISYNHVKQTITNRNTGVVEILETTINTNGDGVTKSTIDDKTYTITETKDNLTVEDNDGNMIMSENFFESQKSDLNNPMLRSYGNWSNPTELRGHKSLWVGIGVGSVVTILTAIATGGLSTAAQITWSVSTGAFATYVVDERITDLWYITRRSYRFDLPNEKYQGRDITDFYTVSNYTGYSTTATSIWTGDATN
ncbi:hypothetical protein [Clostridium tetani]|uniref:hypothetical protein n=1 Tax=Clostridium tetani TaxID=1513 RepID=UPI0005131076|nr:hypothetical protein [Clostridium tetani]KGI41912.1 hypothetical protein KY55_12610 [Clostridium tetani]RXI69439.1 hypothetical protein DP127_11950 [Clostridium tetani]BDR86664.1 hypothetical protein N071400001_12720 [Clostridium tetani]